MSAVRPAATYAAAAVLAAFAVVFAAVTTVVAFREITTNQARTRAAVDGAFTERAAFIALEDEETGIRGFVATGDPVFLAPYDAGRAAYARVRPRLDELDGSVRVQADRVAAIADGLQTYFAGVVAQVRQGKRSQAIGQLRAGKQRFDALRREDARALADLDAAIDQARGATRSAIGLARAAIIATAFVLLLAGAVATRLATAALASSSLARRDALTKLPNRRAFEESLERALATRRPEQRVAVLYIDLDRFKPVNDELGHAAGDELLEICGERLRRAVRPGDVVARVGGDEFGAILAGVRASSDVHAIGARIRAELETPFSVAGTTVRLGASVGIAVVPDDAADAAAVVRMADEDMYRAKRAAAT